MDMINNFIGLTLQLSVPIILGALCGTIAERGGIILLGVEGIMLIGAFAGAAGSYAAGSAMAGVLLSVVLGGMIGWFYALFCLKWKAHQSVVGVGINLFASGRDAEGNLADGRNVGIRSIHFQSDHTRPFRYSGYWSPV